MKKYLRDIVTNFITKINLQKSSRGAKFAPQKKGFFFKPENYRKFPDIYTENPPKYIHIKGQKFHLPKNILSIVRISVFGLLIILFINILNVYYQAKRLEKEILNSAKSGYGLLTDAGKISTKSKFQEAIYTFQQAQKSFEDAKNNLWFVNTRYPVYVEQMGIIYGAVNLLEGGEQFAKAGRHLIDAIELFNQIPLHFVLANTSADSEKKESISKIVREGLKSTEKSIQNITLAYNHLKTVDAEKMPLNIRNKIVRTRQQLAEVVQNLQAISTHFPALLKLLGDNHSHRYLVLFQNNNEIRPTGGFIGSYGIIDVNDGYIEKLEVYDSYDLDANYGEIIEPPDEIKYLTGNWHFRDSNYSPDFPTSAAKARWFLQKQGGPNVDTVIAINQGLLRDMLAISGPIQVGDFGSLTGENYNLLLSFVIESKLWGAEDPKHILKVFVPEFKKAILQEKNLGRISSKLIKAIKQKHLMMYSPDNEIQAFFEDMGVAGNMYIPGEKEDYLSVNHVAIGGTKSEQFITEEITHDTMVGENGIIIDELSISRKHNWDDQIYFQWKNILQKYGINEMPDRIIDILGRGPNEVATRIYVPNGAELISSNKTVEKKYDQDLHRTYFSTRLEALAGATVNLKMKYKLPFMLNTASIDTYSFYVEKQPGSIGSIFTKRLMINPELRNMGTYPPSTFTDANGTIIYGTNLIIDRYFSGIIGKD